MADVQDRVMKISEFFKELQVTQVDGNTVIYVVVNFPMNWIIDKSAEEKYGISVAEGHTAGEYYFCTSIETGFDKVFDAIDFCIQVNKDAMERAKLFQEKIKELKEIFGDEENSIKKLRTLEFTFPRQKKEMNKKRSPIEEVVDKELGNDEKDE